MTPSAQSKIDALHIVQHARTLVPTASPEWWRARSHLT